VAFAGVAVSLLGQAFGVDPKDTNALASRIVDDPDAVVKIKKLEFEHAETLAKVCSQDYTTEVNDRIDARKNAGQYKDFMRHMAYLVTVGFFAALVMLLLPITVEANERELLSMLVGMLVSKWQTIIDFFYGSSHPNQGRRIEK
jgi:hypothetical protein